jgi:L-asparaginase
MNMLAKRKMILCYLCGILTYFPLVGYAAESLPLVKILSTGGTIAEKYDPVKGGLVPALTGEDLVQAVPKLKEIARIEVEDVVNVGSADMNSAAWIKVSKRMNEVLADPNVAGVVITHGTDTMEETAYFMDLTLTSQKPVVLVGALLGASEPDADGPRNLLNAVKVAISPEASGKGAMVVMNGHIAAARDVTKINTTALGTFQSLEFGWLGVVDLDGKVRFYRAPLRRQTIPLGADPKLGRVEIVMHYADADGRVIRGLLAQGELDGLVIAGTGVGNVSQVMYNAVKEVRDRGIPVVISTRIPTGRIMPLYAAPGRGVSTKKIGCVLSDNLSPQKSRILLLLALTKTKDPVELQKYFDN